MSNRGTRFEVSVLTFGPVGRVLITGFMVLVPVYLVLYANPGYLLMLIMWVLIVMPKVLRDVWRHAVLPEDELTQLRDRTSRELAVSDEPREHQAFDDPPSRW